MKRWLKTPNGWTYHNNYAALAGDTFNLSSAGGTTADLTMSAMIGSAAPGAVGVSILGVIATTTQRSFLCIGDSISAEDDKDSRDASADFGILSRVVGGARGYCNAGRSSSFASSFIAGQADRRIALAAYASDVPCFYGINDITGGASATTTRDRLLAIRNLFPTKRFYLGTLLGEPRRAPRVIASRIDDPVGPMFSIRSHFGGRPCIPSTSSSACLPRCRSCARP